MLKQIKSKFYSLIKSLGYNITDNAEYVENFPWLMLRTNNYSFMDSFNAEMNYVSLTLDIFSKYTGEKEIIEIIENIKEHIPEFIDNNPEIIYAYQKQLKILDDKKTGPVRKHGVAVYDFILGYGIEQEEQNDNTGPEE